MEAALIGEVTNPAIGLDELRSDLTAIKDRVQDMELKIKAMKGAK
jgi:hypothetical protein